MKLQDGKDKFFVRNLVRLKERFINEMKYSCL